MDIEAFLLTLIESEEYKKIQYKRLAITELMMLYISWNALDSGIDRWLIPFRDYIKSEFIKYEIAIDDLVKYMLRTKYSEWIYYAITVTFKPKEDISWPNYYGLVEKNQVITPYSENIDLDKLALIVETYILDYLGSRDISLLEITKEEVFAYQVNDYKLSKINGATFKRDGIIFDNKGYYYNPFINKTLIDPLDEMPGFAVIIKQECEPCDVLYRLDEQLAMPEEEYRDYTGVPFERFYGPQFSFEEKSLKKGKTVTVHIDEVSMDKLLMVIKNNPQENSDESFLHIEIETLPYPNVAKNYITTFLHGMYFPSRNVFIHIDYTRNEYQYERYKKKYQDSQDGLPIDTYTEDKEQHYKIWCVENGKFSIETWYKLVMVSLEGKYQKLFNEIVRVKI